MRILVSQGVCTSSAWLGGQGTERRVSSLPCFTTLVGGGAGGGVVVRLSYLLRIQLLGPIIIPRTFATSWTGSCFPLLSSIQLGPSPPSNCSCWAEDVSSRPNQVFRRMAVHPVDAYS
jgi:hypothetical protein